MHDDFVCMHTGGSYVTASGLNCAVCGEQLCTHDEEREANEHNSDVDNESGDNMHASCTNEPANEPVRPSVMIEEIDGNDWTRTSKRLRILRDRLQEGTRGILPGSDCLAVEVASWVAAVNELYRIQKQCDAYGEMHCLRIPTAVSNR